MVESVVLKDFYVDWYYAGSLGWEPTTADPRISSSLGRRSVQEIMKDLGRGS